MLRKFLSQAEQTWLQVTWYLSTRNATQERKLGKVGKGGEEGEASLGHVSVSKPCQICVLQKLERERETSMQPR